MTAALVKRSRRSRDRAPARGGPTETIGRSAALISGHGVPRTIGERETPKVTGPGGGHAEGHRHAAGWAQAEQKIHQYGEACVAQENCPLSVALAEWPV